MENPAAKVTKQTREEAPKDSKQMEQLEKSLGIAGTTEEKYKLLMKKVADFDKDNKRLSATVKQQEKQYEALQRERESLQKDYNKNVLMKTKLEQVCREQQKLLKSVQNESLKHKETQAKFQHSINEISLTLNKNNDENIKLKDDNIEMTKKLKYLAEQYQIREKQLEKINEQVQLENQLHEAKLAKVQMEATMEKEILLREKQGALDDLLKCKKSIQEMQLREEALKEQLSLYTSKYDDFQSSLQKSNDIFTTYKAELEKMVKKTKKLEKESSEWRRKCEKSTASLLDLSTEKQVKDEYIGKTQKQMQQLQKLLRTLQAERTTLHKTLKDNNIDIPPMPVLPPEPEPVALPQLPQSKPQPDKIETMAKSCAELKQSLAMLQNQMSALTTKQKSPSEQAAEPAAKSKNKKNKSRNNKGCPVKDRNVADAETKPKGNANEPAVDNSGEQSGEVEDTVATEFHIEPPKLDEVNNDVESKSSIASVVSADSMTASESHIEPPKLDEVNNDAESKSSIASVVSADSMTASPSSECVESCLPLQNGSNADENGTSQGAALQAENAIPA